ncbi:MAG: hypothetical protein LBN33_05540, partial [Desulfovibrio sp.]|nr:hypothetical protein [Desulfovibrio sp.]
ELGLDLSGQGDPRRSQFLKELIARLDLPRGSSAFWPLCLPAAIEPNVQADAVASPSPPAQVGGDADIFCSGLTLLKPTLLIFFGPQAVEKSGLPLDIHSPFTLQIYNGLLNVLLPPLDHLLVRENSVEQCFNFLRDVFTDFPPLTARFRLR